MQAVAWVGGVVLRKGRPPCLYLGSQERAAAERCLVVAACAACAPWESCGAGNAEPGRAAEAAHGYLIEESSMTSVRDLISQFWNDPNMTPDAFISRVANTLAQQF